MRTVKEAREFLTMGVIYGNGYYLEIKPYFSTKVIRNQNLSKNKCVCPICQSTKIAGFDMLPSPLAGYGMLFFCFVCVLFFCLCMYGCVCVCVCVCVECV